MKCETNKELFMQRLTERQNAVLIGSVLGDLHIQKTPSRTGTCRLRFCHSVKQKEFVDWKYQVFEKDFCQQVKSPFVEKSKTRNDYLFYTSYRDEFKQPHTDWYSLVESTDPDKGERFVKQVPLNITQILTDPLALAVWYLDDGTKRSDTESCRIATQSFLEKENKLLQEAVATNFTISAKIEDWGRTKEGNTPFSLSILSKDYKRFRDEINDIVKTEIPSMLYKL